MTTGKAARGTGRKAYVRLSAEQVMEIWLLRNSGESGASVARRFNASAAHIWDIWKNGRRCEACGRLTTSKGGKCKGCVKRRRPSPLSDREREQILELRSRGMTYDAIAEQLDVSTAKVRKVLDPAFQGKRTTQEGIVRIESRSGQVTFHAHVHDSKTRRGTTLGPYSTHDEAEEARRVWKAKKVGVRTPTPRKDRPGLADVYGNVRLALRNLDAAAADVPMLQARGIFAALHEAEDLIREALRDDYSDRFGRRAA